MQKKKIFIEINVPDQLKRRLAQKIDKWRDLPIKWMKEKNFHITVSFVGYVDESVVPEICRKVSEAANEIESFEIFFDNIELAPDAENPRMVWITGKPIEELGKLNETIEKALDMHPQKHKKFSPHIMLGKIRKLKWNELAEKPIIAEKMNIAMSADAVFVMESKGGEEEYVSLEECPLA